MLNGVHEESESVRNLTKRLETLNYVDLFHEARFGVDEYTKTIAMDILSDGK